MRFFLSDGLRESGCESRVARVDASAALDACLFAGYFNRFVVAGRFPLSLRPINNSPTRAACSLFAVASFYDMRGLCRILRAYTLMQLPQSRTAFRSAFVTPP
ncbi:hypothetical protein PSP6_60124 [Paraburkholderia tropica]|nr:hypothetical protein PSP6_60124 [Paraburkholderia tropica]